jgi:DNA-binding SARP family transcriptional activator
VDGRPGLAPPRADRPPAGSRRGGRGIHAGTSERPSLLDRPSPESDGPTQIVLDDLPSANERWAGSLGTLGIHLLGQPRLEIDRHEAPGPRGWKAWALLAYLLLARGPASRDRLSGLLFGDAADPLGALRWNLAELRRALGPSVAIGGDPVVLVLPAGASVDVLALGSATWVEAVRVPGLGLELLEGVDTQPGAAFESWLLAERRHVAGLSAAVLREAATACLAMGSAAQAIELATKLVAFDEFDEEANALLIRAYVASGAVTRARDHLDATAARFKRELGVEPTATLTNAIDTATPTSPATRPAIQGATAAESLITAGEAAVSAGVLEPGLEILRRAVVDAHEAGEPTLETRALVALGTAFVHGGRGRDGEGAIALHAALRLAEESSTPELISEASRELGYIEMKQARYERAASWLQRAVAVSPDQGRRAAAMAIQGAVLADEGRTADGGALLEKAASIAATLDKPRLEAWALAFLARGQLVREEWEAARLSAGRSIEVSRAAGWIAFLPLPQSLLATVDLATGRVDRAAAAFESAFALGCQIGDPCWEGVAARGIGLVHLSRGDVDSAIAWLDDARTRCVRIPDSYLWIHAYCLDALCETAIQVESPQARAWVGDLETLAARTGMNEMLVRAQLHRARLGDVRAVEAARLFADRIDNPAVLMRVNAQELRTSVAATPA